MDSIPVALRPLVHRLESVPDLSRKDLISVLFVVRLGDSLHRSFNATFLTLSLVSQLCEKLEIPDLLLEEDVFVVRWSFRQGTVSVAQRIMFDYDMYSVSILSRIGRGVLKGTITPKEGLKLIRELETKDDYGRVESWYRYFPGRIMVLPLMACTCATVYFGGTWLDLAFSAICGLAAGIVAWLGSLHLQVTSVMDYLAAIVTAMISVAVVTAYPDSTCFSAQVLGTLYWFLYGTAFVVALYEITNNQLMTGVTRFMQATLRSYGLAFGVLLGIWIAAYGGRERFETVLGQKCSEQSGQIPDIWFILLFPLSGIACLMQFRVGLQDFVICLIVQTIAYGFQYLTGTVWKYPEFLSNMIPAFLATVASHVCIVSMHRVKLSGMEVTRHAYIEMKKTDQSCVASDEKITSAPDDADEENGNGDGGSSNRIAYVDSGWAKNKATGYVEEDPLSYSRSDTWFCLLPALYLLVPGSKLLQTAFQDLLSSLENSSGSPELGSLASSLFVIALGQVVGLRLGFAFLWAFTKLWTYMCDRCRTNSTESNGAGS